MSRYVLEHRFTVQNLDGINGKMVKVTPMPTNHKYKKLPNFTYLDNFEVIYICRKWIALIAVLSLRAF